MVNELTTITKKPFSQLAPRWHKILRDVYNNNDSTEIQQCVQHFPQLADYEECILNECVKNTYNKFTYISKLKKRVPTCFVCSNMAHQSFIMMMAIPHTTLSIQQRIKEFYKEMVPEIEYHFYREHSNIVNS